MLELIKRMFEETYIPDVRKIAEVVPILKMDPPTDTNNYSGVTLISSTMRLICATLTNQIQRTSSSATSSSQNRLDFSVVNQMSTRDERFVDLRTGGCQANAASRTDNAFHARERRRRAAPRIHPDCHASPMCRAVKASLHTQTG